MFNEPSKLFLCVQPSGVFVFGIFMLECFIAVHTESEKHARVTAARRGTINEARYNVPQYGNGRLDAGRDILEVG